MWKSIKKLRRKLIISLHESVGGTNATVAAVQQSVFMPENSYNIGKWS